jgi:hypothetical protein
MIALTIQDVRVQDLVTYQRRIPAECVVYKSSDDLVDGTAGGDSNIVI